MKYSHIVFDIDGTLIDSNSVSLRSLQEAIKLYSGQEIPTQELEFSIGKPANVVFRKLNISDITYADSLWEKCYEKYIPQILPFSGIENTVKTLHQKGYTLGIITTKTRSEYKKEFELLDIHKYFQTSVCLNECNYAKPNPDPIYKYLKLTNISKKDMLYVGDSNVDMLCASNASVDFAHACWGSPKLNLSAKYSLEHSDDLLKILEEMP